VEPGTTHQRTRRTSAPDVVHRTRRVGADGMGCLDDGSLQRPSITAVATVNRRDFANVQLRHISALAIVP